MAWNIRRRGDCRVHYLEQVRLPGAPSRFPTFLRQRMICGTGAID
jgi:hypothetical protein